MPQSLDLAAFVFGAVLILLSLVAGSFKLFGAEVQGTVGKFGRVIAFVLGLILIASRLIPSVPDRPAVAQTQTDGPSRVGADANSAAPALAETADDEEPPGPPGRAGDTQAGDILVGTWKADYPVSEGSMKTKTHYDADGTFTGVDTVVSKGLTTRISTSGTWRIRPLSSTRFKLTTHHKEMPAETYTFRVVDHDKLENEDLQVMVHRAAGD